MRIENHRQRFAATLRMPEYTTFTIRFSSVLGRSHCFINRKILVVSCQNLKLLCSFIRKADKILYDIQKTFLFKDSFKESIKLSILCILITAVLGFPFHETVFAGSNRAGLRCHKVTHNANTVVNKHGRNLMHIIPDL